MAERHTIEWSPVAQRDFDQILAWLVSQDSLSAAVDVHDRLLARIEALAYHPRRCRVPPELLHLGVTEYRELVLPPYSVFFRIQGTTNGLVGVLDRRRDLEDILLQRVLFAD